MVTIYGSLMSSSPYVINDNVAHTASGIKAAATSEVLLMVLQIRFPSNGTDLTIEEWLIPARFPRYEPRNDDYVRW